ncbi:MAG TPA: AI-2E family transporter [Gemmataceae bacterium]|nr:AI-2E family transporter [Gemmataceae bacterium]
MASRLTQRAASYIWPLVAFVLVVLILYVGKPVLVPLALAILLTFILAPVVFGIQRIGLPRLPAVLLVVTLTLLAFAGVGWVLGTQVQRLARELPSQRGRIEQKLEKLRGSGQGPVAGLFKMLGEIVHGKTEQQKAVETNPGPPQKVVIVHPEESSSGQQLLETVSPVLEPLADAGLILVLVVFMLIRREDLRNRVISLLGHTHLIGTTRVIVDTAQRLSRFLLTQFLINVSIGVLFACGLLIFGVEYAFLWGALLTILRFVPYIGAYIALAFPLLLSFASSEGFTQPIEVLVLFGVLELVTANVVEPLLFGHGTGVSPIALLVAAAFWAWVWGPIGLVLSTPLTVCLVVLGQHVDRLRFLALVLGDEPALEPHASYYQRLLARDKDEAAQVVTDYAKAQPAARVFDDVLVPALVLARRQRKQGSLAPEDEEYILNATHEILDTVEPVNAGKAESAADEKAEPTASPVLVVGCPAHNQAEELCLAMLGRLLQPDGYDVQALSTRTLPTDVEATIERRHPALVFIAVMPPGGLMQASYLCRRLHKRFSDMPIVVGYWGHTRHYDRLLRRLRKAGASYVTTSLAQTRSQLEALASPPVRPTPAMVPQS